MNKKAATLAKFLRRNMTIAEIALWRCLRDKQMKGLKFRRQEPMGNYIVDFVCHEKKVIIEIDGGQHAENFNDKERDKWLNNQGYKVLRFWNNEVLTNINGVIEILSAHCFNHPPFYPSHQGRDNTNNN